MLSEKQNVPPSLVPVSYLELAAPTPGSSVGNSGDGAENNLALNQNLLSGKLLPSIIIYLLLSIIVHI